MKKVFPLFSVVALALAACAPTVVAVVETPVRTSKAYTKSCTTLLNAVRAAGLQIRPSDGFNTYHVVSAGPERVLLVTELRFISTTTTTSSVWTCARADDPAMPNLGILTVSTTGLQGDVAEGVHQAFFSVLDKL